MKTSHLLFAFVALAALLVITPRAAEAGPNIQSSGKLGLGIALGYPNNGISVNTFLGQNMSLQIDGTIRSKDDWLGIGARADLLFWMPQLASLGWADVAWYWGPGANVHWFSWKGKGDADSYVGVGAELPVGIALQFSKLPIDLALEAVPVLGILGTDGVDIDFDIVGALKARWYF